MQLQERLVRGSAHVRSPDCHLMPCPRGALSNLKALPLDSATPGPGEIKVRAASTSVHSPQPTTTDVSFDIFKAAFGAELDDDEMESTHEGTASTTRGICIGLCKLECERLW